MSKIPKQIDDRLKDAIVNIEFVPSVPPETVIGYFHNALRDELSIAPPQNKFNFLNNSVTFETSQSYFITKNGPFRIDVTGQGITFNLLGSYTGWHDYFPVVGKNLKSLFDLNIIQEVTRVSIRYINQFDNVRIYEHIQGNISIGSIPDNSRGQMRVEFQKNQFSVITTIVNGYSAATLNLGLNPDTEFSLIDVDVIKLFPPKTKLSYEEVISTLESAHDTEKDCFFSLLKEEFIQTLNPIY